MNTDENLLGKRIQELRKCRNLTQQELAEKISVDPKYISRLETGSSMPSMETLSKLAKVLDVEIAEMFAYSHFKDNDILIAQILEKLKLTNNKNIKLIYDITNDIVNTY